jgi:hypothetical protein
MRGQDFPPAVADWAARTLDFDVQLTPVQTLVERCCNPALEMPNLSYELELADYVNTKRANTPREAAFEVVAKVNSRIPHVGMLALHLLDILVKNCGYPMHLQIATKDFLNELVRRFPERPPVYPSVVQMKILEMIHEWRQTICTTSRHKEDLVHIRDMHRLLTYKGYRFPKLNAGSAAMLNQDRALMSPEELEEEERTAQSAKLQELIRRGTPRDLAQAQELMKIMSGAQPAPDNFSSHTAKELEKIVGRVNFFGDLLDQAQPSEKSVSGDVYDQVARHLRSVQPRLQQWITQAEADGSEHLARYLEVNDMINQILARYDAFSRGESAVRSDLISLDEPAAEQSAAAPSAASRPATSSRASAIDDLTSLSLVPDTSPAPAPAQEPKPQAKPQTAIDLLGDLDMGTSGSSSSSLFAPAAPAQSPAAFSTVPPARAPAPAPAPADPFADLAIFK